jgi:hypothetical protein
VANQRVYSCAAFGVHPFAGSFSMSDNSPGRNIKKQVPRQIELGDSSVLF